MDETGRAGRGRGRGASGGGGRGSGRGGRGMEGPIPKHVWLTIDDDKVASSHTFKPTQVLDVWKSEVLKKDIPELSGIRNGQLPLFAGKNDENILPVQMSMKDVIYSYPCTATSPWHLRPVWPSSSVSTGHLGIADVRIKTEPRPFTSTSTSSVRVKQEHTCSDVVDLVSDTEEDAGMLEAETLPVSSNVSASSAAPPVDTKVYPIAPKVTQGIFRPISLPRKEAKAAETEPYEHEQSRRSSVVELDASQMAEDTAFAYEDVHVPTHDASTRPGVEEVDNDSPDEFQEDWISNSGESADEPVTDAYTEESTADKTADDLFREDPVSPQHDQPTDTTSAPTSLNRPRHSEQPRSSKRMKLNQAGDYSGEKSGSSTGSSSKIAHHGWQPYQPTVSSYGEAPVRSGSSSEHASRYVSAERARHLQPQSQQQQMHSQMQNKTQQMQPVHNLKKMRPLPKKNADGSHDCPYCQKHHAAMNLKSCRLCLNFMPCGEQVIILLNIVCL